MSDPGPSSRLGTIGLAVLLVALGVSSVEVILTMHTHQVERQDLAELEDVAHGLLDPNVWITQVTAIVETKIEQFQLTSDRRKELKPILEHMLEAFVTKADDQLRQHRDVGDIRTQLKEDIREKLLSGDDLKAGIPADADAILDEMAKPTSKRQLEHVLQNTLSKVSRESYSPARVGRLPEIHREYGCDERTACEQELRTRLADNQAQALRWTACVLTLAALLLAGVGWSNRKVAHRPQLAMLIVTCALLMACGVLSPMLDVEARISDLSFVLLGEPMEFKDQVLYFQSKSVLDVVRVLAATGKPGMILVSLLLVTFSVFFPLAKITCSFLYLFDVAGLRRRALVQFFALKSSKWSMADVFVVAMFMAYIGFNGVVDSELLAFTRAAAPNITVLSTNGSSLQLGYFLFLGFCIAGLVTSTIFNSAIPHEASAKA